MRDVLVNREWLEEATRRVLREMAERPSTLGELMGPEDVYVDLWGRKFRPASYWERNELAEVLWTVS